MSIVRVLDGGAYATAGGQAGDEPVTFEGEAEKPTRAPGKKVVECAHGGCAAAELELGAGRARGGRRARGAWETGEIEAEAGE